MAVIADFILEIDSFNRPKILRDLDAKIQSIKMLIMMSPGTMPDAPNMGVDIAKYRYRFIDAKTLNLIQSDIEEQCKLYLPTLMITNVLVEQIEKKSIGIAVTLFHQDQNVKAIFVDDQKTFDLAAIA